MFKNPITRHPEHRGILVWGRPISLVLVVAYKGLFGLVETVFGGALIGVSLWFNNPNSHHLINRLIAKELSEDPHDTVVNWILTHNLPFSSNMALRLSVLVLILGLLKLLVAAGIWYRSPAARTATMVLVATLGLFGLVELARSFAWFKLATVFVDGVLYYYLWRILPKYFVHPGGTPGVDIHTPLR